MRSKRQRLRRSQRELKGKKREVKKGLEAPEAARTGGKNKRRRKSQKTLRPEQFSSTSMETSQGQGKMGSRMHEERIREGRN